MTEIAKLKTRERQKRRREKLDEIARAHGFPTWTKLETAVLEGSASVVKIPMIQTDTAKKETLSMITDRRQRVNSIIAAQDAFNMKSDRLIERLRAAEITVEQYEALLEEARETLEEARERLS